MKTKNLDKIQILFLLDNFIMNNIHSNEKKNIFIFNNLFDNCDYDIKRYFDKLLNIFEVNPKTKKLSINDFLIIGTEIKLNSIFAESFFGALTIEIISIRNNLKEQKIDIGNFKKIDFILRSIIYIIFKTIIFNTTHNNNIEYKKNIVELLNNIYDIYNKIMSKKLNKYSSLFKSSCFRKKKSIKYIQDLIFENSQIVVAYLLNKKGKKNTIVYG